MGETAAVAQQFELLKAQAPALIQVSLDLYLCLSEWYEVICAFIPVQVLQQENLFVYVLDAVVKLQNYFFWQNQSYPFECHYLKKSQQNKTRNQTNNFRLYFFKHLHVLIFRIQDVLLKYLLKCLLFILTYGFHFYKSSCLDNEDMGKGMQLMQFKIKFLLAQFSAHNFK